FLCVSKVLVFVFGCGSVAMRVEDLGFAFWLRPCCAAFQRCSFLDSSRPRKQRRFSLPFLRDRVILRLEVFFLSRPSRLFLMVKIWLLLFKFRFPVSSFCPLLPLFLCVSKVLVFVFGCG